MRSDVVDDPGRLFAERLDRSFAATTTVFHDWRGPSGNSDGDGATEEIVIDHVVVASSGLWVVIADDAPGRIAADPLWTTHGGRSRLVVGDVDRSASLDAARTRAAEFVAVLEGVGVSAAPVQPVVCLLTADWEWFARPVVVDGVLVTWSSELIDDIKGGHWWDSPTVVRVTDRVTALAIDQVAAG